MIVFCFTSGISGIQQINFDNWQHANDHHQNILLANQLKELSAALQQMSGSTLNPDLLPAVAEYALQQTQSQLKEILEQKKLTGDDDTPRITLRINVSELEMKLKERLRQQQKGNLIFPRLNGGTGEQLSSASSDVPLVRTMQELNRILHQIGPVAVDPGHSTNQIGAVDVRTKQPVSSVPAEMPYIRTVQELCQLLINKIGPVVISSNLTQVLSQEDSQVKGQAKGQVIKTSQSCAQTTGLPVDFGRVKRQHRRSSGSKQTVQSGIPLDSGKVSSQQPAPKSKSTQSVRKLFQAVRKNRERYFEIVNQKTKERCLCALARSTGKSGVTKLIQRSNKQVSAAKTSPKLADSVVNKPVQDSHQHQQVSAAKTSPKSADYVVNKQIQASHQQQQVSAAQTLPKPANGTLSKPVQTSQKVSAGKTSTKSADNAVDKQMQASHQHQQVSATQTSPKSVDSVVNKPVQDSHQQVSAALTLPKPANGTLGKPVQTSQKVSAGKTSTKSADNAVDKQMQASNQHQQVSATQTSPKSADSVVNKPVQESHQHQQVSAVQTVPKSADSVVTKSIQPSHQQVSASQTLPKSADSALNKPEQAITKVQRKSAAGTLKSPAYTFAFQPRKTNRTPSTTQVLNQQSGSVFGDCVPSDECSWCTHHSRSKETNMQETLALATFIIYGLRKGTCQLLCRACKHAFLKEKIDLKVVEKGPTQVGKSAELVPPPPPIRKPATSIPQKINNVGMAALPMLTAAPSARQQMCNTVRGKPPQLVAAPISQQTSNVGKVTSPKLTAARALQQEGTMEKPVPQQLTTMSTFQQICDVGQAASPQSAAQKTSNVSGAVHPQLTATPISHQIGTTGRPKPQQVITISLPKQVPTNVRGRVIPQPVRNVSGLATPQLVAARASQQLGNVNMATPLSLTAAAAPQQVGNVRKINPQQMSNVRRAAPQQMTSSLVIPQTKNTAVIVPLKIGNNPVLTKMPIQDLSSGKHMTGSQMKSAAKQWRKTKAYSHHKEMRPSVASSCHGSEAKSSDKPPIFDSVVKLRDILEANRCEKDEVQLSGKKETEWATVLIDHNYLSVKAMNKMMERKLHGQRQGGDDVGGTKETSRENVSRKRDGAVAKHRMDAVMRKKRKLMDAGSKARNKVI